VEEPAMSRESGAPRRRPLEPPREGRVQFREDQPVGELALARASRARAGRAADGAHVPPADTAQPRSSSSRAEPASTPRGIFP